MGLFKKGIAAFLAMCVTVSSIGINVQAQSVSESEQIVEQESTEANEEYVEEADSTKAEEVKTDQGILNFIMLESEKVQTPGVQNIAVSLGREDVAVEQAELVYQNITTGETFTESASEIADNMIRFTIEYTDESQSGIYDLVSIKYQAQGSEYEVVLEELGMEVNFGVNREGESEPDEVLLDDEMIPEVEANVVSMDENGNTVSEQSIEDVLENAGAVGNILQDTGSGSGVVNAERGASASKKMVIILDPGHDSVHAGARYYGCNEEELALKIAKYCKSELQKYSGVTVYMTRTSNACPNGGYSVTSSDCNAKRVEFAVSKKANVYVSLHLNASTSASVRGVGVYYPNNNYRPNIGQEGKGLATDIYKKLSALGLSTWAGGILIHNSEDNTLYPDYSLADYLGVIRRSKLAGFPAVLVEHAFLSNAADVSQFLNTNAKLKKLGVADAQGIAAYYGLSVKGAIPEIISIQSKNSQKLQVSWTEALNAESYQVYRSTSEDGKYKKIAEVSKSTYSDTSVKAGVTYYYKVCAVSSNGAVFSYSQVHAGMSLAQPEISSIVSKAGNKLTLKWKAVSGSEQYEVYRSEASNGKYTKIATTTKCNYTDSKLTTQKDYFYKVRAHGGENNGYSSYGAVTSGWTVKKTSISSVSSYTSTSLCIKWKKVPNAYGYRIQRSTSKKGTYKTVAELKKNKTSYIDEGLNAKKKYYYKVQALNSVNGKIGCGSYCSPVAGSTITSTSIIYVKSNDSSIMEIQWKKDAAAYAYSVKRSTKKNGTYQKIAEIRDCNITKYEDKKVTGGQRYYYVVETIIDKKGVKGYSGDSKPVSAISLDKVNITDIQEVDKGFVVNWDKVSGANCYEIMRSTSKSSGFTEIAKVRGEEAVSFTDMTVTEGVKYYYRIRAIREGKYTGYGSYGKVAESNVYKEKLQ